MKRANLKTFIRNIYNLLVYDYHLTDNLIKRDFYEKMSEFSKQIEGEHKNIFDLQVQIILSYYEEHKQLGQQYVSELSFLKHNGFCVFPYQKIKSLSKVNGDYDTYYQLPFVMHNDKRLYFPSCFSVESCIGKYIDFVENENILGGNFRNKSPHQYQTESFKIEEGDVLLDVGCAEALLSLDVIEKVKKIYLIESDPLWIPALTATFAPYKNKCVILNKLVSDKDSDTSIKLSSIISEEDKCNIFVKMDIEGYEYQVLESSIECLKSRNNIKFACCTYHNSMDADMIEAFFKQIGKQTEFSDGYKLFPYGGLKMITPPYFRKGLIRAY